MTPCFYCGEKIYGIPDQMYGHPICSGRCVAIHDALKKHKEHLEMTDLTKNKEAFGLMDEADQAALLALPDDQIEQYVGYKQGWAAKPKITDFMDDGIYRQKPEPSKPVIETRSGEGWVRVYASGAPYVFNLEASGSTKSTYTQTTIDGKFARCVITAEGYTPTLTDEQARNVYKDVHGIENPTVGELSLVRDYFAAIVKMGVM